MSVHRQRSRSSEPGSPKAPRSPSPSQIYHRSLLPQSVPTTALVESVAGAAHYSGVRVDPEALSRRYSSHDRRLSHLEVKADHELVMADLKDLYTCKPTLAIFDRWWSKDAVFEDPFCHCEGFQEYAAQWFAMPKLFSKSESISTRVMSSTHSPNRLVYSQTQEYTFRLFGHKKVVNSIIIVDFDENEKIIRLVDQWDGKDLPTRYGASLLRRMNAKVMPWLVHVPKHSRSG